MGDVAPKVGSNAYSQIIEVLSQVWGLAFVLSQVLGLAPKVGSNAYSQIIEVLSQTLGILGCKTHVGLARTVCIRHIY